MESNNINWFPGHMAKAKRQIQENIKLVDAVVEVTDARIPVSSRNPDILGIISNKPHLVVLNKSDLADMECTEEWIKFYKKDNITAVSMECNSGKGIDFFIKSIKTVMKEKIDKWNSKGMRGRTIKVMIIGTPNTGKSSLINRLSKKSRVKAENRPGVTRGSQWVTIDKNIELLDTPGILPTKIHSEVSQRNIAFVGSIKDEVLDIERLSLDLIDFLYKNYRDKIQERYQIDLNVSGNENILPHDVIKMIGRKRGFLISGGEIDFERSAKMILSEFRAAKLGRITLERAEN